MSHFSLFAIPLVLVGLLFGLLCFAFWVWMLVDCAQNQKLVGNEKIIWILVIVLLHTLGALIYFFAARNKTAT